MELIYGLKNLHAASLEPICTKYNLNQLDVVILLYIANNAEQNTATDIIKSLNIKRSTVSVSVRKLQDMGLVESAFENGNHRSQHLSVNESANDIIAEGMAAHKEYFACLVDGFSEEELKAFKFYFQKFTENVRRHASKVKNN